MFKPTNLQITIFIDQNTAWFEITVYDACRMNIFQSALDLLVTRNIGVTGGSVLLPMFDRESTSQRHLPLDLGQ